MIRIAKPIRLYEWGDGTNTLNQVWTADGDGRIVKHKVTDGKTHLVIELNAPLVKKNDKSNLIKLAQQGEGMTGASDRWGEVAMGTLKTIEQSGRVVTVEITTATKLDTRK